MLTDVWPLFGLVLRTPRLELRLPSLERLAELGELAAEGVHDPAVMPFFVAWTDRPPAERAPGDAAVQLVAVGPADAAELDAGARRAGRR